MLTLSAIAFAVGIFVGDGLELGRGGALGGALLAALALMILRARGRSVGLAALTLAFWLGALGQGDRPRPPPELVDGELWDVSAEVAAAPERALGRVKIPLALETIARDGIERPARGRVQATLLGEPIERLLPGDRVHLAARFHAPRGFLVPGAPDGALRAAADGVVALAGLHDPAMLSRRAVAPDPIFAPARTLEAFRQRMLDAVRARIDGVGAALVESLVLGDRGDVDRPLDDAFRIAGVSHVLSVSGLHLAIAAFLFYVGLTKLLLRLGPGRGRPVRRFAALAALPATVIYTVVTGAQVATLRACVVAGVWLVAVALGRRATISGALSVAALLLLAFRPLELFDPSFQLSFAAALGTALLAPRFSPHGAGGSLAVRLGRWSLRLIVASAAAILATAPIAAWHFSQLAPAGILSNLVVVPLAELAVVPTGLTGCVLAAAHLPGGDLLVRLAGFQCEVMASFVRWFAAWAPSWRVAAPSLLEIVGWYGALLALALELPRRRLIALGGLALVVLTFALGFVATRASTRLTAHFLDVGQGDACVLELPHGHAVVIDGGGSFDAGFDPGQTVLAPFLWRRGIRRIDLIILSHPHPDHANGLGFLVENFPVGEVWTNGEETTQPGTVRLLAGARARHVPLGPPRTKQIAGVTFRPLAPLDEKGAIAIDPALGENDNSLVVAVEYAGRRLLFSGDIEAQAESRLITSGGLASDLVKVPHHGSRTSSSAPFVAAVRPRLAVISVGDHNRWHFPNPGVVARWRQAGARVLRTDLDGTVTVALSANGALTISTMRRAP
ncbi:MAG TPA: DNA internalization-related competence protein ComEC/Rec2 [Polyangia bacterium]